jgi:hypothetical protein
MIGLSELPGDGQPDSGDETEYGVPLQIKVEVRKKRTFFRRDIAQPADADCEGDDPRSTASQPMSIEVREDTDQSEVGVHATSLVRKTRRYRIRSVQPDYEIIHRQHITARISLRVLHSAYRSGNANSRTYGYAHFCAGYVRWLTNLPDSGVPA